MRFLLCSLLLLLSKWAEAQSNIQVGKAAPPIIITDWIANVPADKDLTTRPVVLEFWATWCAPCLEAVPHLNELQSQFAHTDLRFVSLTDEPVEKVNRLLKRIPFQSVVASDQSKKTQIAYGNGKTGLEAFPLTVFIDTKGIIRWIGNPNYLDKEILQNLLADNPPPPTEGTPQSSPTWSFTNSMTSTTPTFDPVKQYMQMMKDGGKDYHFEMRETKQIIRSSAKHRDRGLFYSAATLQEIWEEVFNVRKVDLILPDSLATKHYVVSYKNIRPNTNFLDSLKSSILTHLVLMDQKENIPRQVYKCVLSDTSKLERTMQKPGLSGFSDSGDQFALQGQTLDKAFSLISSKVELPFVGPANVDGRFDFTLNKASAETIAEGLRSYGFTVTKVTEPVTIVRLVPRK
jgi:thiol-disulfide isomerase/thioredoxin